MMPRTDLKAVMRLPSDIRGSELYTVIVEVTNMGEAPVEQVRVESQTYLGKELLGSGETDNPAQTVLYAEKEQLVRELELQVRAAYEMRWYKSIEASERVRLRLLSLLRLIAIVINRVSAIQTSLPDGDYEPGSIPTWARQAVRIREWSDVERLKEVVVSHNDVDSFLKDMYEINSNKLKVCLERISKVEETGAARQTLESNIRIPPGSSRSFPLKYKAPRLLHSAKVDMQCLVSFVTDGSELAESRTLREPLRFKASAGATHLGALAGALLGYVIRFGLVERTLHLLTSDSSMLIFLFSSLALSIVAASATAASESSGKKIVVEDFSGGVMVGVLSILFTDDVLSALKAFTAKG